MAPSVIFRNFAPFRSCSSTTWRRANFGEIRATSGSRGNHVCACVPAKREIAAFVALHTNIRATYATHLSFGFFLVLRETLSAWPLMFRQMESSRTIGGLSNISDCSLNYLPLFRSGVSNLFFTTGQLQI